MKNKILLSFENEVSEGDYKERVELVETFSRLPIEFFFKNAASATTNWMPKLLQDL